MSDVERTLFSALVALAAADGEISPEERAWLREVLEKSGVHSDAAIEHAPPLNRQALREVLQTEEDREAFLQFGLLVAMSDGNLSPPEYDLLQSLAKDLDISESEFEELRHTTIVAIEPG